MSSLPPEQPPPPSAPVVVNPLPWEARESRGFVQALFDTMGLFVSRPQEAWARTREVGDLASPLLFGIIVSWISFAIHSLISKLIVLPVLPGVLGHRLGAMGGGFGHTGVGFVVGLIFAPVGIAVALFIGAAVLHLCCMVVGALSGSRSGFEGSFRVVAYSSVASLANIIPVIGHFIALVWGVILAVMGIQRLHRTEQGKAIAAVLIPVVVCCGGIILIGILVGMAFFAHGAR